jgi:hypothetical protein
VAQPIRRARLDSVEGLAEDLKLAREVLGLANADGHRLAATVQALIDRSEGTPIDALVEARALLQRHVEEVSAVVLVEVGDDPCGQAVVDSLNALLLPSTGTPTKADLIRRMAIRTNGCHLGTDAIRKREDALIVRIADSVLAELAEMSELGSLASISTMVERIAPVALGLEQELTGLLRRLREEGSDRLLNDQTIDLAKATLFDVARMHFGCQGILLEMTRPRRHSMTDLWFAMCCYKLLGLPFQRPQDRVVLAKSLEASDKNLVSFLDVLANMPEGRGLRLILRWQEVICGCHDECEYGRSRKTDNFCLAHRFTWLLREFYGGDSLHSEGTLRSHLAERFEQI